MEIEGEKTKPWLSESGWKDWLEGQVTENWQDDPTNCSTWNYRKLAPTTRTMGGGEIMGPTLIRAIPNQIMVKIEVEIEDNERLWSAWRGDTKSGDRLGWGI